MIFMKPKISEGVELLAKHMLENPRDWKQGDYEFYSISKPDLRIWTANGCTFLALNGNKCFTRAEQEYVLNAIKKSIAFRLLELKEPK